MKVAAYIRVSKEREGMTSPDLYRTQIRQWAESRGIEPEHVHWYEDIDISGRLPVKDRPAFATMLDRRDEYDTVVVPNMTRFGRIFWPTSRASNS